ncbi:transcriptional regulator, TetR family [Quadrisphaera granulorum]|uniref:TetR family transcriptional regulator n=1 Tax=Quadrisphaera granulorum TaxID=317664 RepID=A0A316A0K5_9ACTN|nr:TetR/AcrR family transcriptional regulator C-terminal domain-containing protein [Quadrisphaera granulorum]PWJ50244.1 TetR family transcriptional regulator [Quadrisphaera granulorum]SZE98010.1 transcriptional regulator, TetR family [Quadrisphaera granulorum]
MARPRTRLLDRDRIVTAALRELELNGQLTMSAVSRRLSVHVSSLYEHVKDRAELVDLIRDEVTAGIDADLTEVPEAAGWRQPLEEWLVGYRAAFARHPRAIGLLTTEPIRSHQAARGYDRVLGLLRRAGVPPQEAMATLTALECFVLGSALDAAAPDAMVQVDDDDAHGLLGEALRAEPSPDHRADHAFTTGLRLLLDGLAASAPPSSSSS